MKTIIEIESEKPIKINGKLASNLEVPKERTLEDVMKPYLPAKPSTLNLEDRGVVVIPDVLEPLPHYYVSVDGNDITGDGSAELPFATPFKAISVMEKKVGTQGRRSRSGGGTVFIGDGTYRGGDFRTRLNHDPIRYADPITIKAINEGQVTIKGSVEVPNNWVKVEGVDANMWTLSSNDYDTFMLKGNKGKDGKYNVLNPQQIFINGARIERLGYLTDKLSKIHKGAQIRQSKIDAFKKYQMELLGWTKERFNESFKHIPKSYVYQVLQDCEIPMQATGNFWEGYTRDALTEENPYGLYENTYQTIKNLSGYYDVHAWLPEGINPNDEEVLVEMSNKSFIMDLSKSMKLTLSGINFEHSSSMSSRYSIISSGSQGAYLVKVGFNAFVTKCKFTNGDFSGVNIANGWNFLLEEEVPFGERIPAEDKGHYWSQFLEARLLDGKDVPVKDMLTTIYKCEFSQNGVTGCSIASAEANIIDNVFKDDSYQPYENFWHSAAAKYATQAFGVFANNKVLNVGGNGVWFDWCFTTGYQTGNTGDDRNPIEVYGNYIDGVGRSGHMSPHSIKNQQTNGNGMFFEVSSNGRFYNNVVKNARMRGIMSSSSSDAIFTNNTVINSGREQILLEFKERLSTRGHESQLRAKYSGVVEVADDGKKTVVYTDESGDKIRQLYGFRNNDMWFDKDKFPSVTNITLPRVFNNVLVVNNITFDDAELSECVDVHIDANNINSKVRGKKADVMELVDHNNDGYVEEGFEEGALISSWDPSVAKFTGGIPKSFTCIGGNIKVEDNIIFRPDGIRAEYRRNKYNIFIEDGKQHIEDYNEVELNPFSDVKPNTLNVPSDWTFSDEVKTLSDGSNFVFPFLGKDYFGNVRGLKPTIGAIELVTEEVVVTE